MSRPSRGHAFKMIMIMILIMNELIYKRGSPMDDPHLKVHVCTKVNIVRCLDLR